MKSHSVLVLIIIIIIIIIIRMMMIIIIRWCSKIMARIMARIMSSLIRKKNNNTIPMEKKPLQRKAENCLVNETNCHLVDS